MINMIKRILNFCKLTIKASPVFFILNILILSIFALAQLGMAFSFKYATDIIMSVQNTGSFGVNVALPILFFS